MGIDVFNNVSFFKATVCANLIFVTSCLSLHESESLTHPDQDHMRMLTAMRISEPTMEASWESCKGVEKMETTFETTSRLLDFPGIFFTTIWTFGAKSEVEY